MSPGPKPRASSAAFLHYLPADGGEAQGKAASHCSEPEDALSVSRSALALEEETDGLLRHGQIPDLPVQGRGSLKENKTTKRSKTKIRYKSEHAHRKRKIKTKSHIFKS